MEFLKLIEDYKDDIIKSTQEIIRIKSVEEEPKEGMPFGEGPYKAIEYVTNLSKHMGFDAKDFDGYAAHADIGDGKEIIGILAHVDVVPEGSGWTYPPYAAEIHEDKIYGRGTLDDKGPTIAAMYAMKALKESNIDLKRKIRIIFGSNEESGWGGIKYYFKNEKAPDMAFTPDADFPVIYGEKGILIFDLEATMDNDIRLLDLKGGSAANMVPDYCEAIIEVDNMEDFDSIYSNFRGKYDYPINIEKKDKKVKIIATGVSAHGSTPEKGKNAISYLMKFLGYIFNNEDKLSEFVKVYNDRIGFLYNGEKIGCGLEDDISGKLNFNPGVIKLEDGKIVLTVNIRYPIKSSKEEVFSGIRQNLKDTNVKLVKEWSHKEPLHVPKDNFLVKKLMEVYREETGDEDSSPITIGGGTYARAMENAVAFGPMFPGQTELAHQKDEYISIDHLMKLTRIYAKALYQLAK